MSSEAWHFPALGERGSRALALTAVSAGGAYVVYKAARTLSDGDGIQSICRRVLSLAVEYFNVAANGSSLRTQFRTIPLPADRAETNNPHDEAARPRAAANAFVEAYAHAIGRVPYFVSMSAADQKAGRLGSRGLWWVSDLKAKVRSDRVPDNALMVFVDVDYYVDMPSFLATNRHPVLIFTKTPTAVADTYNGTSFTFNQDNELVEDVPGGSGFKHRLWNYAGDASSEMLSTNKWLPFPLAASAYLVERRGCGAHRSLILLTPIGRWRWYSAWLSSFLYGAHLHRLSVHEHLQITGVDTDGRPFKRELHYSRLRVLSSEGDFTSTGRSGAHLCATVLTVVDNLIAIKAQGESRMTTSTAFSALPGSTNATGAAAEKFRADAAVLAEYHNRKVNRPPELVYYVEQGARRYNITKYHEDTDSKQSMFAFMKAIVPEGWAPDRCKGNDAAAVNGRVTDLQTDNEEPLPAFELQCMREFVALTLGPRRHTGMPVAAEVVFERMPRPTQQAILREADVQGDVFEDRIKAFVKTEAMQKPGDPRLISTITAYSKYQMSRFTYAMSAELKERAKWYGVGKTPKETAERVVEVAMESEKNLGITDFRRFDGHVEEWSVELDRQFYTEYFMEVYRGEVEALLARQVGMHGTTKFGVGYEQENTRASGGPNTSDGNTRLNGYLAYRHYRYLRFPPAEAYARLGIYVGDDGISRDVAEKAYKKVARIYNQDLDIEVVPRGALGVSFLARFYGPDVFFGDPNSMCDVRRQLSKLHLSGPLPASVTPLEKLLEKCRSFYLTDANTPVIGRYVTRVLAIHDAEVDLVDRYGLRSYAANAELSEQYPNEYQEWMDDVVARDLPDADMVSFDAALIAALYNPDILLNMPALVPPTRPRPAQTVADGDPPESAPAATTSREERTQALSTARASMAKKGGLSKDKKLTPREVLIRDFMRTVKHPASERSPAEKKKVRDFFKNLGPKPPLVGIEPNPGPPAWAAALDSFIEIAPHLRYHVLGTIFAFYVIKTVVDIVVESYEIEEIMIKTWPDAASDFHPTKNPPMTKDKAANGNKTQRTVADAVAKIERRREKTRTKGPKAPRAGGETNNYLAALLDPATGPVVGIPDTVTTRSVKFRTHHTQSPNTGPLSTSSACVSVFAPSLGNNSLTCGSDAAGSRLHLVNEASPASQVPTATFRMASCSQNLVGADEYAMMLQNFAAIRPVAYKVVARLRGAAGTVTGTHSFGLMPGDENPCQLDATGFVFGGSGVGGTTFLPGGVSSAFDANDASDVCESILNPIECLWAPEDPRDIEYMPTEMFKFVPPGNAPNPNPDSEEFAQFHWSTGNSTDYLHYVGLPVYAETTAINAGPSPAASFLDPQVAGTMKNLPKIRYAQSGLPTGANVAYTILDHFIVWEALPKSQVGAGLSAATSSPSNPDELVQAANVMEVIPKATSPSDATDLGGRVQRAAVKSVGHLYDPTVPRKQAIEGTSISRFLGAAAPALGLIPGIGGMLGAGASFLSAIAR
jgi:hypothetical protein